MLPNRCAVRCDFRRASRHSAVRSIAAPSDPSERRDGESPPSGAIVDTLKSDLRDELSCRCRNPLPKERKIFTARRSLALSR